MTWLATLLMATTTLAIAKEDRRIPWDLTIELDVSTGELPDQICLVTPMPNERVDDRFPERMTLEELVKRNALVGEPDAGLGLGTSPSTSWPKHDRPSIRRAFGALLEPPRAGGCSRHVPGDCRPELQHDRSEHKGNSWVVMCTESHEQPERVAFLTVVPNELDVFTPYIERFELIGSGLQIRFNSARTKDEYLWSRFQASVGVAGGHYHRTAERPSFDKRLRLPLRPLCQRQRFALRQGQASSGLPPTVTFDDGSGGSGGSCEIDRMRGGVFELLVPLESDGHHVTATLELTGASPVWLPMLDADEHHARQRPAPIARTTASRAFDHPSDDVLELEPAEVYFEWSWPCGIERPEHLECPAAKVLRTDKACTPVGLDDRHVCAYSCSTAEGNGKSVGWPVTVELEHEALGMTWSYPIGGLSSAFTGRLVPAQRRVLPRRIPPPAWQAGTRTKTPGRQGSHREDFESWPGSWTRRLGDEISGASIEAGSTKLSITELERDPPAQDPAEDDGLLESVAIPGRACHETVRVRYEAKESLSRHYFERDTELDWPYVDLPSPTRSAFRATFGAHAGTAWAFARPLAGKDWVQWQMLSLAVDAGWRPFDGRPPTAKVSGLAGLTVGLRYFALLGRKQYLPLAFSRDEQRLEELYNWRHGPALRVTAHLSRRHHLRGGIEVGPWWNTAVSSLDAAERLPIRREPSFRGALDLAFQYKYFHLTILQLMVFGPDFAYRYQASDDGEPRRQEVGRWSVVLNPLMIGVTI